MSYQREHEVKLELVDSIAASQHAIARLLHSMADVIPHAEVSAKSMEESLRLLTAYQHEMARMLGGISLPKPRHGVPSSPWLPPQQRIRIEPMINYKED